MKIPDGYRIRESVPDLYEAQKKHYGIFGREKWRTLGYTSLMIDGECWYAYFNSPEEALARIKEDIVEEKAEAKRKNFKPRVI